MQCLSPDEVEDVHCEDWLSASCAADAREEKDSLANSRLRVAAARAHRRRRIQVLDTTCSDKAGAHEGKGREEGGYVVECWMGGRDTCFFGRRSNGAELVIVMVWW